MTRRLIRCSRCARRCWNSEDWSLVARAGVVVGHVCPGCLSPEEHGAAVISEPAPSYEDDLFGSGVIS